MSEEALRRARGKIHELYQMDEYDFPTMCKLFDSLVDIEEASR